MQGKPLAQFTVMSVLICIVLCTCASRAGAKIFCVVDESASAAETRAEAARRDTLADQSARAGDEMQAGLERAEAGMCRRIAGLKEASEALAKKPGARIGLTVQRVINETNWGPPDHVNRTVTASGNQEQWVYGDGAYLYFENGRLVSIHTSSRR
jgi:hypothetical protein